MAIVGQQPRPSVRVDIDVLVKHEHVERLLPRHCFPSFFLSTESDDDATNDVSMAVVNTPNDAEKPIERHGTVRNVPTVSYRFHSVGFQKSEPHQKGRGKLFLTWMRWLLVSATTTSSSMPRQKPCGELNWPCAAPSWPKRTRVCIEMYLDMADAEASPPPATRTPAPGDSDDTPTAEPGRQT